MEAIRKHYRIPAAIGISATLGSEADTYALSHLRFGKEGIDLVSTESFAQLEDLASYCPAEPATPVSLYLEGKGILVKEIPRTADTKWDEELISQIFPHFSADKFYYSYLEGTEYFWVAIAKRDRVDGILLQLEERQIAVVQLFIGPFVFDAILKQVNTYNKHYLFAGHAIQTDEEGVWNAYRYDIQQQAKFQLKVGNRPIDAQYIGSYAAAFNTLMHEFVSDRSLSIDRLTERFQEALAKIQFKNNGLLLLATTFILLVLSTVLYSYYYSENEVLSARTTQQASSQKDVEQLQQEIAQQDSVLKELGWNGGVSKTWLLDQLGVSLNEAPYVSLTDIRINPQPERRRGAKVSTQDNRNKIVLKGKCATLDGLNQWVRKLNQEPWVDQVQITQFTESQVFDDEQQVFSLEIIFSYDVG
ncbi:hypothetical protein FAZ19_05775 [Sphingobacterium alkalisoli]|uniref:PilN domain-containing protein n=1 Tax=Sphingobacterium alkalisoli TaxID=1874115 RepID=A0A4U0H448_9SPHI|nr:hypothetical protein [Sphingobacterium alkalisoli]TJY66430.1 hypothetical protein FAZ19_05775 [Sphingobacterium alkalisoli]GGH16457.1 hypothetical protein GCM10011418_18840 [Sphingobacterium alkalisoli]